MSKTKKPLGPGLHWNILDLERQAEVTEETVQQARGYLKRRGLKRAARLLEASIALSRAARHASP